MVLERVARALDLAFVGASAKLVGELVALREPRRAERVALREQAARRIGHGLATIAVVAVVAELFGAAFGAEAERLIGDELIRGDTAVELDDRDFVGTDATGVLTTPRSLFSHDRPRVRK